MRAKNFSPHLTAEIGSCSAYMELRKKYPRRSASKGLIDSKDHGCVEIVRVLSFKAQFHRSLEIHSKKDDRFNEPIETLLSIGSFEEGLSKNFEPSVYSSPLTSGTLKERLM